MSQPPTFGSIPNSTCTIAEQQRDNMLVSPDDATECVPVVELSRPSGPGECLASLEYDIDDKESEEFFDGLPLTVRKDREHVRLHMGRASCRRRASDPYSIDETGALRFKGKLVSDGGCHEGYLKDPETEKLCFGLGCADTPHEKFIDDDP